MKKKRGLILLVSCHLSFLFTGCHDSSVYYSDNNGNNDYGEIMNQYFDVSLPQGELQFTDWVLAKEDIEHIIPLGQIKPPEHTFPTDHMYFVFTGTQKVVYAPTGGKIIYIKEKCGSYADEGIGIAVTRTLTYYLEHILIDEQLKVGDSINAGMRIGVSGNTSCVDFGLLNSEIDNGFPNFKNALTTYYGDKPLTYYSEPLRTELYALVEPPESFDEPDYVYAENVTDGAFALNYPGTIQGNWFREDFVASDSDQGGKLLAFGYDVYYPHQVRIGYGLADLAFALHNDDQPVKPLEVSVASGRVIYQIYNANNTDKGVPSGDPIGIILVELINDERLRFEIFNDSQLEDPVFTNAATYYNR